MRSAGLRVQAGARQVKRPSCGQAGTQVRVIPSRGGGGVLTKGPNRAVLRNELPSRSAAERVDEPWWMNRNYHSEKGLGAPAVVWERWADSGTPVAHVPCRGEKETVVGESSLKSGAKVAFKVGEAVCPDFEQILTQMTTDLELSGEVAFFSDYGDRKNHFAIIDVAGVLSPVIVPVSRLRVLEAAEDNRAATR